MPAALPRLWIDGAAFGARVLRGGDDPWDAPGELGLFLRELSALLALAGIGIGIGAGIAAFAARKVRARSTPAVSKTCSPLPPCELT